MLTNDPKILGLAFLGGIIPSLLWLWFWMKEERSKSEPKKILALVFIMGMLTVILVLPIQKFIQLNVNGENIQLILSTMHISIDRAQLILWASAEEIIKYLAVLIVLYKTSYIDEPIDWPIYLITAALGFTALENTLFLQKSLALDQTTFGLLTAASIGQLRFLGSTLLHAVTSGILGIALGISLHLDKFKRKLYLVIGLVCAITLHSIFNIYILKIRVDAGNYLLEVLKVFGFLWVVTIIVMLLFEKIRRMS